MSAVSGPGRFHWEGTPSDTENEPQSFSALYINTEGTISIVDFSGVSCTYTVGVGLLSVGGVRINETDTTVTSVICLRN
jgi:hypothetical protein